MKTGLRSNRALRLLGVLLVALAVASFAAAGRSAAADPTNPPVPSDAELFAWAEKWVNSLDECHVPSVQYPGVSSSCSEVYVHKMHEPTIEQSLVRWNMIVVEYHLTMPIGDAKGQLAYENWYRVCYGYFYGTLPDGLNSGGLTESREAAWAYFTAGNPTWVEGWDLRPIVGPPTQPPAATPSPSGPLGPCNATIDVPAGLKAGDTLSPSATVTSADGTPAQGEITEVWYFNGVQANSVTWDGNPVQVILQLSCQGHAQDFTAAFNGTMGATSDRGASATSEPTGTPEPSLTPEPTATPTATPSAAPSANPSGRSGTSAAAPGLGGVGSVPGPADGTQGVIGMVAPGILGILGGLLAGGFGGGAGGTGGTGGTGAPVGPDGKAPSGGGTPDKGSGPDGSGPAGEAAATQAAKDRLGLMSNWAVGKDNKAFMAAINDARANAFDANGDIIPDKYAAALKAIRDAVNPNQANINSTPGDLWIAASSTPSFVSKTAVKVAGGVKDFAVGTLEGIVTTNDAAALAIARVGMAAVDATNAVGRTILGIGLEGARQFGTPGSIGPGGSADSQGAKSIADAFTRLRDSLPSLPSMHDIGTRVKDALPGDEYEAVHEAWTKGEVTEDALWAVPSAACKIAQILTALEAPTPAGAGAAAGAEAAAAARAASAADAAAAVATHPEVAAAVSKVEQAASDALKGGKLPNTYQGCRQVLAEHPELAQACDDALVANGGTGALGNLRGAGAVGNDAHTLVTARLLGHQEEVLNEAGKQLLQEVVDKIPPGQPVPTRFTTLETTEGSRRVVGGAGTGTDLDRALHGLAGKDASAADIAALEQRHQALIDQVCADKGLGLDHKSLGANIYAPPPGRLAAPSAAGTNPDSWVRNNALGTKAVGGFHPVAHVDGKAVVGDHVGGYSGRSALTPEQEFAAPSLSEGEAQAATAEARTHLQEAVASGNVKDAVKSAARIAKIARMADRTNPATIPNATLMKAAATRDELLQRQILRDAGITDVTDIEGLLDS